MYTGISWVWACQSYHIGMVWRVYCYTQIQHETTGIWLSPCLVTLVILNCLSTFSLFHHSWSGPLKAAVMVDQSRQDDTRLGPKVMRHSQNRSIETINSVKIPSASQFRPGRASGFCFTHLPAKVCQRRSCLRQVLARSPSTARLV